MYEERGVPFRTYMYVPEVHPVTNATFYEREDDAYLLKVKHLSSHQLYSIFVL